MNVADLIEAITGTKKSKQTVKVESEVVPITLPIPPEPAKSIEPDYTEIDGEFREYLKIVNSNYACTEPANRDEVNQAIYQLYEYARWQKPEIKWYESPYAIFHFADSMFRDEAILIEPQMVLGRALVTIHGAHKIRHLENFWRTEVMRSELGRIMDLFPRHIGFYYNSTSSGVHLGNMGNLWLAEFLVYPADISALASINRNGAAIMPFDGVCFVADRPCELHFTTSENGVKRFHKDGGMAIQYRDGIGDYFLNGIRMRPDYVIRPAEKISPREVISEPNVDIRRELIRKVGIERMLEQMSHRIIDKHGTYELLSVVIDTSVPDARYLKMINPSVGCFHLEGVDQSCLTVQQALNWRAGDINKEWVPSKLT